MAKINNNIHLEVLNKLLYHALLSHLFRVMMGVVYEKKYLCSIFTKTNWREATLQLRIKIQNVPILYTYVNKDFKK